MAIFRWGMNLDPFAGFRQLHRELERLVRPGLAETRRIGGGAWPPVNIYESEDEVLIQCEVPGVRPGDLDVSITGETLIIKGSKRPLGEGKELRFIRCERGSGEFTRTIVLGQPVDAEKIRADLQDGIMSIRLPKATVAKSKQIEVKTAD